MQNDNSGKNGIPIKGGRYNGCIRSFTQHSRSFYANTAPLKEDETDQVIFGFNSPEGCCGEFVVTWHIMGGEDLPIPQLTIFSESWEFMEDLADVFSRLGKLENQYNPQPEEVIKALIECGFVDKTRTTLKVSNWIDFELEPSSKLTIGDVLTNGEFEGL